MEKALKFLLDYFILTEKLRLIIKEKEQFVRNQEYQKAADIRVKEDLLREDMPSLEDFKKHRRLLNAD